MQPLGTVAECRSALSPRWGRGLECSGCCAPRQPHCFPYMRVYVDFTEHESCMPPLRPGGRVPSMA